jgi:hypothetical protein
MLSWGKFRSDVPGKITGIRFYKAVANTGVRVASLWTNRELLATQPPLSGNHIGMADGELFPAPYQSQQPVYVASYHCETDTIARMQITFPPPPEITPSARLARRQTGTASHTATTPFSRQSFNSNNYWVDVICSKISWAQQLEFSSSKIARLQTLIDRI